VSRQVLILGAGFAGLELASCLSESLAGDVQVTLLDENDSFYFGFSKLDVMLGRRAAADVRTPYSQIAKDGVEFRRERVTAIDPARREVRTDAGEYRADFLVVALGARYDLAATPGLERSGFEYYSLAGAERLRDRLAEVDSGAVLMAILGQPFKCPPAPFEGAFMIHSLLSERGVRDAVTLRIAFPMKGPVPVTQEVSRMFIAALEERGIEWVPQQRVVAVEDGGRSARLESGGTEECDLFIGVPVHRVPQVVEDSGLAVDGWVPVDPANLSTRFENVYAVGDVAAMPVPKAGVFAEGAARVVAADIAAKLGRSDPPGPYEGTGSCYVEFGDDRVGKVEVNFLGGPSPSARLHPPSTAIAAEEKAFGATRRHRWFGA
jgi:sulfide:quinone oxidoreductase